MEILTESDVNLVKKNVFNSVKTYIEREIRAEIKKILLLKKEEFQKQQLSFI